MKLAFLKTIARCIVLASATMLMAGVGHAAGLEGNWKGTWTKGGDALPVTVTFAKSAGGYSGSFDSDALQVVAIPFAEVAYANGKVHFLLKGDQTSSAFDGKVERDEISGTFVESSVNGTFSLRRAAQPAPSVRSRDVTFANGDATLAGTLLLPAASDKHFAVLFLHGSGPEARWANRYLAQRCAEAGIAALIYDKRGVGRSTGNWQTAGFDALAGDAVAGIRFLQAQPEATGAHIGIYGHSQGATFAPLVASRAGNLDFVIAASAGGLRPADVETYSVENSIGVSRLAPAEQADARAFVHALIDVAYRGKDRALLAVMAAKYKGREWYFDPPPPDNSYWTISRLIAGFEPARAWRQVHARVLLLYGGHDERVPPVEGANAILAALKAGGNTHVTLKNYPTADHAFFVVDPPNKTGWPRHEPDYAETLTQWILSAK